MHRIVTLSSCTTIMVTLRSAASIMMIEGLGQQTYGSLNWGDGLVTDHDTIANMAVRPQPLLSEAAD